MVHIYYGDGKGKTTAAVGLCVRAAGRNQKILFVQFLKPENSGERYVLAQLDHVILTPCPVQMDFTFNMTDEQKSQLSKITRNLFERATVFALTEKFNMIILDEIFSAIEAKLITESDVYSFVADAPETLEIVMTGHNPSEKFFPLADYISKIEKIKHPFDRGIGARTGIEF